jgi:hypothetical protein
MLGSLCERISLERRRKMPKKRLSRSSRSCGRSTFCRARAKAWQWRARRHARRSENSHRIFFALEVEGPTRGCSALSAANLIKRNGCGATSGNCGIDGLMSVTGTSTRDMGHDVTLITAHIVFIGGAPRLAEDLVCSCRLSLPESRSADRNRHAKQQQQWEDFDPAFNLSTPA